MFNPYKPKCKTFYAAQITLGIYNYLVVQARSNPNPFDRSAVRCNHPDMPDVDFYYNMNMGHLSIDHSKVSRCVIKIDMYIIKNGSQFYDVINEWEFEDDFEPCTPED